MSLYWIYVSVDILSTLLNLNSNFGWEFRFKFGSTSHKLVTLSTSCLEQSGLHIHISLVGNDKRSRSFPCCSFLTSYYRVITFMVFPKCKHLKSDSLQYNTVGRWVAKTIVTLSDGPMFILIDWELFGETVSCR
jgi:hypothetical protein